MPLFSQNAENEELELSSNSEAVSKDLLELQPNYYHSNNLALSHHAKSSFADVGMVVRLNKSENKYLFTDSLQSCFPVCFRFKNGDTALYHLANASLDTEGLCDFKNYSFSQRSSVPSQEELEELTQSGYILVNESLYFYNHVNEKLVALDNKNALLTAPFAENDGLEHKNDLAIAREQFAQNFGTEDIQTLSVSQLAFIKTRLNLGPLFQHEWLLDVAEIRVFVKSSSTCSKDHYQKTINFIHRLNEALSDISPEKRPQISGHQTQQDFGAAVCYQKMNGEFFMWVGKTNDRVNNKIHSIQHKDEEVISGPCAFTDGEQFKPFKVTTTEQGVFNNTAQAKERNKDNNNTSGTHCTIS